MMRAGLWLIVAAAILVAAKEYATLEDVAHEAIAGWRAQIETTSECLDKLEATADICRAHDACACWAPEAP